MRRAGNAVRLACGHPMCDPGSAECQAKDRTPLPVPPCNCKPGYWCCSPSCRHNQPHGPACTVAEPCSECRPALDHPGIIRRPTFGIDTDLIARSANRMAETLGPLRTDRIRTGVDPEWPEGAEVHRSDCETNSYDSGPCDCGTDGLTAESLALLLREAGR